MTWVHDDEGEDISCDQEHCQKPIHRLRPISGPPIPPTVAGLGAADAKDASKSGGSTT